LKDLIQVDDAKDPGGACNFASFVNLTTNSINIDGQVASLADNPEQQIYSFTKKIFVEKKQTFQLLHPGSKYRGVFNFGVSSEVPWSYVTRVVDAAYDTEFYEVAFLFFNPNKYKTQKPALSPIQCKLGEIHKADSSEKIIIIEELLFSALSKCPNVHNAFLDAINTDNTDRKSAACQAIKDTITECECGRLDLDRLKAVLWISMWTGKEPTATNLLIGKDGQGQCRKVTAKGKATWKTTHSKVLDVGNQGTSAPVCFTSH
jgi:hypothetical protein